jgi:predicted nucleotidyltransferase
MEYAQQIIITKTSKNQKSLNMDISAESTNQLQIWCQEQPVRLCILFGSQATGQAGERSDVDLAIWAARSLSAPERLQWVRELETMFNRRVSLVLVSADLDPVLSMEICRHGRLIYERTPELWFHHRLQLWHAFTDSLPFLRAARQQLHEFAEEVRHGT